jgi:hypothetical protein
LSARRSNMNVMNQRVIQKSFARPNSDGRREQIIDAALKVMITDGVYHATTRKIAEAAPIIAPPSRSILQLRRNSTIASRICFGSSGARSKRLRANSSRSRR